MVFVSHDLQIWLVFVSYKLRHSVAACRLYVHRNFKLDSLYHREYNDRKKRWVASDLPSSRAAWLRYLKCKNWFNISILHSRLIHIHNHLVAVWSIVYIDTKQTHKRQYNTFAHQTNFRRVYLLVLESHSIHHVIAYTMSRHSIHTPCHGIAYTLSWFFS